MESAREALDVKNRPPGSHFLPGNIMLLFRHCHLTNCLEKLGVVYDDQDANVGEVYIVASLFESYVSSFRPSRDSWSCDISRSEFYPFLVADTSQ